MFELERFLNSKKENLSQLFFQFDETNTDYFLKKYLKNIIMNKFNKLDNSKIKKLFIDNKIYLIKDYKNYKINKVYTFEELNKNLKEILNKNKNNYCKNPDIVIEIKNDDELFYETIEFKSTKANTIPGSSIQQIIHDEWIIFVKHTSKNISFITGKYINSINSKMQFPDRSPRPQVSFKELENYNNSHRIIKNDELFYLKDNFLKSKLELINDYQKVLSKRWIDIILKNEEVKNKEP